MKLIVLPVVFLALLNGSVRPFEFGGLGDVLSHTADTTIGLISVGGNYLPTPQSLFSLGKNLIAGVPIETLSTIINSVCSAAISSNKVVSRIMPDVNKMKFQLRTQCGVYNFSFLDPSAIFDSPGFDKTKKTVILVTGWMTTIDSSDTINQIAKAYHCRGGYNFIAIDVASYVDTLYTWSALNTEAIGEFLGKALVKLCERVPLENIHLLGHSLGAHVVGSAGRTFYEAFGKRVPRITGLDPAKPCFNEGESLSGLMRGDADFVDIIHSNPGILGKREPMGDADFYPDGFLPLPKGCLTITCAHERAWLYFAETLYPGNENNFQAVRCSSLVRLRAKLCRGKPVPMGSAASKELKGNYFLETTGSSPFGQNGNKARTEGYEYCGDCLNATTALIYQ